VTAGTFAVTAGTSADVRPHRGRPRASSGEAATDSIGVARAEKPAMAQPAPLLVDDRVPICLQQTSATRARRLIDAEPVFGSGVPSEPAGRPRARAACNRDAATGRYNYVWKTDKAWAGKCRQLVVKFLDGSVRRANFKFK